MARANTNKSDKQKAVKRRETPVADMPAPTPAVPQPLTLREALDPLVQGALNTSLLVHKWGTTTGSLIRASQVLELCDLILSDCRKLVEHDLSTAKVAADLEAQRKSAKKGAAKGEVGDIP